MYLECILDGLFCSVVLSQGNCWRLLVTGSANMRSQSSCTQHFDRHFSARMSPHQSVFPQDFNLQLRLTYTFETLYNFSQTSKLQPFLSLFEFLASFARSKCFETCVRHKENKLSFPKTHACIYNLIKRK